MFKSIEGVYREGKIEFLEPLSTKLEGKVIVTFLNPISNNLTEGGFDELQAASLRRRLIAFVDDWDRPEMGVYDTE